jgi:UDP-N-acetylglucosamine/UDP-N-acetylgalactosamine diphosphorylase
MAGGTSRSNHSEVGSSYIHFNFTPDADKTTPSLLGDVPRGVMLNQPPIFLGGQGGIIGPVRLGYGNVVAAGSILRHDYPQDNQLIFEKAPAGSVKKYVSAAYPNLKRILENNILYLANLKALEDWYKHIRKSFLESQEFGLLLYAGLMEQLSSAQKERLKRLKAMANKTIASSTKGQKKTCTQGREQFNEQIKYIEEIFSGKVSNGMEKTDKFRDVFLKDFEKVVKETQINYIEAIQKLPAEISAKGVTWLNEIVHDLEEKSAQAMPALGLFKKSH